jgi:endonuclease YncB( thermonuclease family)
MFQLHHLDRLVIRTSCWLACVALASCPALCAVTVTRVVDGDTVKLSDGRTIRLAGIDAPESNQPYGDKARDRLSLLVQDRPVTLHEVTRASWGRQQARIQWHDVDVNGWMVRWGAAWVDSRYPTDRTKTWQAWQGKSKMERRGLWRSSSPIAPWRWREGVRAPRVTVRNPVIYYSQPVYSGGFCVT